MKKPEIKIKADKTWGCDGCDKIFSSKIAMKKHVSKGHKKGTHKKKQSKTSEPSNDLEKEVSTGQNVLNCVICDDSFQEKIKLQQHIQSIHGKTVPLDSL